jgi:hypothetical protein
MVPTKPMALFAICDPLMVLAVALAVLPLVLSSHADHRRTRETISRSNGTPNESVTVVDGGRSLAA